MKKKILNIISSILKSNKFYIVTLIFFFLESAWIALSARYPQAFDENFHFGLIKLYSTHLSPIISKQPPQGDAFGAVTRDPSFLYHYLMSWPYRIIEKFIHTQIYQIVILRFIDIIFFLIGLIYFRAVLLKLKLSKSLSNIILFLFILIPIVPQLAGQINYDDLLFLLCGLIFWLCLKLIENILKQVISFREIATLMIVCTIAGLVKYAFFPIYLAIVVYLIYLVLRVYRHNLSAFFKSFIASFKKENIYLKTILMLLIIVLLGMFYQRDILNLIDYGSLAPNCKKILTVKECQKYYVWASDTARHKLVLEHKAFASNNIFYYIGQWFYWMWYRLFFAINGPKQHYINYPPLPLPSAAAILIASIGVILLIKNFKRIFYKNQFNIFIGLVVVFYSIALFIQGLITYHYTAVLENMNGRYLIPILILFIALIGQAYSITLRKKYSSKIIISVIAIVLFLNGGGILTYMIRSNDSWYITSTKIYKINKVARKITKKIVITGKKTYPTKFWFFN